MSNSDVSGIPVINENKKLMGMLTLKEILKLMLDDELRNLVTSYNNILKVLDGKELLRFDDVIEGKVLLASFRSTTIRESYTFGKNDILILADRHSIIEYAINSGVKLIILTSDAKLHNDHYDLAKKNKVNIIQTSLSTFYVTNRIYLSNYIKTTIKNYNPISFRTTDYVEDFKKKAAQIKHTNYPIVDSKNKCIGLLRMADMDSYEAKRVILVDHNEAGQSVIGLNEANILEIIDHHKIGTIMSKTPINFRNMAVGSTNTIIYQLYKDNKLKPPYEIAGLIFSGILSDTLLLKSPTTTVYDEEAIAELESILNLDYMNYGLKMYEKSVDINGKTKEEIFYTDYKIIDTENSKFGVSQVFTLNIDEINKMKHEFVSMLNEIKKANNFVSVSMFVTDIIKEASYVYFDDESKILFENAFNINELYNGYLIEDIVSRKKQIIPRIMGILEK
jgi:manganese-dependent inorganic pyrophosphatase